MRMLLRVLGWSRSEEEDSVTQRERASFLHLHAPETSPTFPLH